jgi:hypothetical protein
MLIGDYFDEISRLVHEHETAGFLLSCDLLTNARSDDLGYLRATLTFSDRSELHVREYVRVSDDRVERLALAYHYQDAAGALRFRYDNAQHRPPVVPTVHKHVGQDLIPAEGVTLVGVLREIIGRYLNT